MTILVQFTGKLFTVERWLNSGFPSDHAICVAHTTPAPYQQVSVVVPVSHFALP